MMESTNYSRHSHRRSLAMSRKGFVGGNFKARINVAGFTRARARSRSRLVTRHLCLPARALLLLPAGGGHARDEH